ncbi:MAG: sulfatase [Coraliomargarita sp.]
MSKRLFWAFALLCGSSLSLSAAAPNFVVILADDLGWMDLNPTAEFATGTPAAEQFYETPHLDQLSRDGVSFSRCYSGPLCTPSRASLITGRNGATFGFNTATAMRASKITFAQNGLEPPAEYLLHDKIPETSPVYPLANATGNYALPNGLPDSNGHKLYSLAEMLPEYRSAFLGKWHLGGNDLEGHRPQNFGFEAIAYEDEGWSKYHQGVRNRWHHPGPAAQEAYLTDDLTALSTDWIRRHVEAQPEQPFLLYLAHFAVHDPIQARPEDVAHFEGKTTLGWNGQDNATYAGMIRALDDSVGAIRSTLKELGVADNTILIFTSDNGGQAVKKGKRYTSNTPLRGQKAQTYEGGIRVPLFVCAADAKGAGRWVDTPVTLEDVAPTLVALAGMPVPDGIQQQWTGESLVPLLQNRPADFAKRAVFIHEPYYRPDHMVEGSPMTSPSSVMIEGDYKLIAYHDGVMRLYDLSKDISESKDLSGSMPERTERMKKALAKWRVENIPVRYDTSANPAYNPQADEALPEPQGELFVR